MKKNKKAGGLIIACLVVAVLLGAYFGMDYLKLGQDDPEPIFKVDVEEVVSIAVTGTEGQYTLKKTEGTWHCQELLGEEIDESVVNYRLDVLDEIFAIRTLGVIPENMETYGLTEPLTTITVTTADGTAKTLCIGAESPDGNTYAMLADDQTVYTIGISIQLALDVGPDVYVLQEEETK